MVLSYQCAAKCDLCSLHTDDLSHQSSLFLIHFYSQPEAMKFDRVLVKEEFSTCDRDEHQIDNYILKMLEILLIKKLTFNGSQFRSTFFPFFTLLLGGFTFMQCNVLIMQKRFSITHFLIYRNVMYQSCSLAL